jgi:hypothetical protein
VAFTVGSPVQAFVDALRTALLADATLTALLSTATAVYGYVPEAARTAYPYLVLGHRTADRDGGAMQVAGGKVTVQLDGWSSHRGASEMQAILSRVSVVLERQTVTVTGFTLIQNSLTCELEGVFEEPDEDAPERRLYHGVQRWTALIEG